MVPLSAPTNNYVEGTCWSIQSTCTWTCHPVGQVYVIITHFHMRARRAITLCVKQLTVAIG